MPPDIIDLTASGTDLRLPRDTAGGPSISTLDSFVSSASADDLRYVLARVLRKSETARKVARMKIGICRETRRMSHSANSTGKVEREKQKGQGDRWKVCVRCGEYYGPNDETDLCKKKYHPGMFFLCTYMRVSRRPGHTANVLPGVLEPDYQSDYWADWDEDCHGYIELQKDEHHGGFMYTCCKKAGDEEGCRL